MCVYTGVRSQNNLSNQIEMLADYKDAKNIELSTLNYVKLAIISQGTRRQTSSVDEV